jgi:hypothetical protein
VAAARPRGPGGWREQVRTGLVNLGWQARDADHAIAAVEADLAALSATDGAAADGADGAADATAAAQSPDAAAMLRAALRKLSRA